MEEKKKFEKPELQVVELKNNLLGSTPSSCSFWCVSNDDFDPE